MLLVNVGRSWPNADTHEDQIAATERWWPVHSTNERKRIAEAADVLIAVVANRIVLVRTINTPPTSEGTERFELHTSSCSGLEYLVGAELPAPFAWKPGEAWPVKVAETTQILASLPRRDPVHLGRFRVQLALGGELDVFVPRGASVRVHTT